MASCEFPRALERLAGQIARTRLGGRKRGRAAKRFHRGSRIGGQQNQAEIEVRRYERGIQLERAAILGRGLGVAFQLRIRVAQLEVRQRFVRPLREDLFQQFDGGIVVAAIERLLRLRNERSE